MLLTPLIWHKRFRTILTTAVVLIVLAGCAGATDTIENQTPPALSASATPQIVLDDDEFCPPPPGWFEYVVRAGDTLNSIAERSSSTRAELTAANCLNNPREVASGTVLYVPQRID